MSWIEKIQSDFIITTGDGTEFKPLWLNANKAIEYNIAEFDFHKVVGSKVHRGTPKGRKFNLEIVFQGEDHLDTALAFEQSASDPRAWTIQHPFYGNIIVQPTALSFDNSNYNVSKITGTVIETILDDNPKLTVDPVDKINDDKFALDETFSEAYDVTPSAADINTMTEKTSRIYLEGVKLIKLDVDAGAYFDLFNVANSLIVNATSDPLAAIQAINAMLSAPALLEESVTNRIGTLSDQFTKFMRPDVSSIVRRSDKKLYEDMAGLLIANQAQAASTPIDGDYPNRNSVLSVIETIIDDYDAYLEDLDVLQTDNGGDTDSYIPDANSLIALNNLINFAVSNLFKIALSSKQERTIYCEDDTNLIVLAHRFYGLTQDDKTIDDIINNNDIGLNEHLQIRKGRKIVYYV